MFCLRCLLLTILSPLPFKFWDDRAVALSGRRLQQPPTLMIRKARVFGSGGTRLFDVPRQLASQSAAPSAPMVCCTHPVATLDASRIPLRSCDSSAHARGY